MCVIKNLLFITILLIFIIITRIYFPKLIFIIILLEVSLVCFILYSFIRKIKQGSEKGSLMERMRMELEAKFGNGILVQVIMQELNVLYYSLIVWFKKAKEPMNSYYTYHKTSQIKTIVIVFSILIIGEGLLIHFLIQRWNEVVAWIFTILNVYGILYLIGLYQSIKLLPHTVHNGKLTIRLGFQSSMEMSIQNIHSIHRAREIDLGESIPNDTYYSLLKIDSPQYEITLQEPVEMRIFFRKKKITKVVFRADHPTDMIEKVMQEKQLLQDN